MRAIGLGEVADPHGARALGEQAAAALRDLGASAYLDALEPAP